jgi:signal transduction histidine kinase
LDNNLSSFSDNEIKDFISKIVEASEQTYKLLEDLLTWAKSQLGQLNAKPTTLKPIDIINECSSSLKSIANNKNIEIKTRIATSKKVFADNEMLKFVIRNLIHNGIKFSHPNSIIECLVDKLEGKRICIIIKDHGIGIKPEKQKILFNLDEFLSTSGTSLEKGTGLGLSLSKEMVEINNGTIEVKSTVNKGSEFIITLPQK